MTKTYNPRPGDYGCVKTNGIMAKLIRLGTLSRWNHAFIYIGEGRIIEANPKGVEIGYVSKYTEVAWNQHEKLSDQQRLIIVHKAHQIIGKPYGFLVIADIALRILGLKVLANTRILEYLSSKNGYICSELVAECYAKAGILLTDKPDYLVTPGDLAERLIYQ